MSENLAKTNLVILITELRNAGGICMVISNPIMDLSTPSSTPCNPTIRAVLITIHAMQLYVRREGSVTDDSASNLLRTSI